MKLLLAISIASALTFLAQVSRADVGCLPDDTFDSIDFSGEVYGKQVFKMDAGFRQLRLVPIEQGWQISIYRADGSIVPVRASPLGFPFSNPTLVTGQDFRNSDNISSLPGRIIRKFIFGRNAVDPSEKSELVVPQLPPGTSVNAAAVEPTEGELGIGELVVEDIGLADLGKGQTPRLTYLKFSGCLGWHRGYRGQDWRMGSDPGVPDETISAMKQCGFDKAIYKLSDHTTGWGERGSSASLEPDLLADGIRDIIAPATRRSDGKAGLGICHRSENRLTMVGFVEGSEIGAFMDLGEYWYLNTAPFKPGRESASAAGDGIIVGVRQGPNLYIFLDATGSVRTRRQSDN